MPKAKKTQAGTWKCRVLDYDENVLDQDGKPIKLPNGNYKKRQHFKVFTSPDPSMAGKREAERMASEWLATREMSSTSSSDTVISIINRYIDIKSGVLSPSTIKAYRSMARNKYNDIAHKKADRIKKTDIQKWINVLSISNTPKTVKNVWGLFTASMEFYMPGKTFSVTLPAAKKPELYTPSDEDVKAVMEHVKGTPLEIAILLAAFGTMRRGEICALTSDDINGNVISVNKSMVEVPGGFEIKQPKTKSSYRDVVMPEEVIRKLEGIEGSLMQGKTPNYITKYFRIALKECDLPSFRFHDLRAYSASIMHAIGVPDQYIMQRGGWKTDNVMKAVYRRSISDEEKKMNEKINGHFTGMLTT